MASPWGRRQRVTRMRVRSQAKRRPIAGSAKQSGAYEYINDVLPDWPG